jgi:Holliday junction DNA helicase RuvA
VIARLAGTLIEKTPERLVLDVGGVGYAVLASLQTFADLPGPGARVVLQVHTEVREDAIELFGFGDDRERRLFHELRRVKGLGPRTCLAILSGMPAPELADVIARGDVARLQTIPGVGRRLAERIAVECRERVAPLAGASVAPGGAANGAARPIDEDAVSALVNLGYRRPEAEAAVRRHGVDGAPLEEVIRAALKGFGPER